MADCVQTFASGEAFREIDDPTLTVYTYLSGQEWLDGYRYTANAQPDNWAQLNDEVKRMSEDEQGRNAFKARVAAAIDDQGDAVTIVNGPSNGKPPIEGVIRWRVYHPEAGLSLQGIKSALGRMGGLYPYLYAPDFLVGEKGSEDASNLLKTAALELFLERTAKKKNIVFMVDTLQHNIRHQSVLRALGFAARRNPQRYNTPPNLAPIIGMTYPIEQFMTKISG